MCPGLPALFKVTVMGTSMLLHATLLGVSTAMYRDVLVIVELGTRDRQEFASGFG